MTSSLPPAGIGPDAPVALAGPLRLLILPVLYEDDRPQCLVVRHHGDGHVSLLETPLLDSPPRSAALLDEAIETAVQTEVWSRLSVRAASRPVQAGGWLPVRLPHPRQGRTGVGWMLPVGVRVTGEPAADPLLAGFALLAPTEVEGSLTRTLERAAARAALGALGLS